MKRILIIVAVLLFIGAAFGVWLFLGSATGFSGEKETLYIRSASPTKKSVIDSLAANKIMNHEVVFEWLAERMGYWDNIRPGKYEIKKGTSALSLVRMLRNGQQTPVNLVIRKLRTKEDLARLVGYRFECDSAAMLAFLSGSNEAFTKAGLTPETVMTVVLPDTYTYLWNTTPEKIFSKLQQESNKFWTTERKKKASQLGLTPVTATILASIVEEETTAQKEKGTVASVYLNRIAKGMPLQADPTVKFALKDFGLKRIYEKHLSVESPYNTYRNTGLPPGPICTPQKKTIEAVIAAPQTEFIYFVASPAFDGTHDFSVTYGEHLLKAKKYQQALNRQDSIRKNK